MKLCLLLWTKTICLHHTKPLLLANKAGYERDNILLKKLFSNKNSASKSAEVNKSSDAKSAKRTEKSKSKKGASSRKSLNKHGQSQSKANKPRKKPNKTVAKPAPWDASVFKVAQVDGRIAYPELTLHSQLLHAIYDLGFEYCTPIQAQTLPHTLKGLDVIGKAQTGTGKTAAFLITAIDQILSHPVSERFLHEPRVLVLAPTRELVHQIEQDAKQLTKHTELHTVALVGGEPHEKQRKQLDYCSTSSTNTYLLVRHCTIHDNCFRD